MTGFTVYCPATGQSLPADTAEAAAALARDLSERTGEEWQAHFHRPQTLVDDLGFDEEENETNGPR